MEVKLRVKNGTFARDWVGEGGIKIPVGVGFSKLALDNLSSRVEIVRLRMRGKMSEIVQVNIRAGWKLAVKLVNSINSSRCRRQPRISH